MGEVLPNAIPLMAKAAQDAGISVSGTVKEMMDLQMQGALISSKVLPHFAKRMSEAARANGGLEAALNSNRVAMNRMITSFQMAADAMFKSGFVEGLTDLFNTVGDMISENMPLWKSLGKIIGGVLSGVSDIIDNIVAPVLSALGSILNALTDLFGDFSGWIAVAVAKFGIFGRVVGFVWKALSGGRGVIGLLTTTFRRLLLPIMLVLGALEELAEFFSPTGKKTLIGTNINEILKLDAIKGLISDVDKLMTATKDLYSQPQAMKSVDKVNRLNTYTPYSYGTPQPVTVQGDVYLDGEKVGRQVMSTESAKSAIDSRTSDYRRY